MMTRGRQAKTRPKGETKASRKPARVRRAKVRQRSGATTKRRKIVKRAATVASAATGSTHAVTASPKALQARLRRCMRRIVALETELKRVGGLRAKERKAARLRMTRARRQFESRLTRMVQEIGQLRHHEVRARTLERKLAAREREIQRLPTGAVR